MLAPLVLTIINQVVRQQTKQLQLYYTHLVTKTILLIIQTIKINTYLRCVQCTCSRYMNCACRKVALGNGRGLSFLWRERSDSIKTHCRVVRTVRSPRAVCRLPPQSVVPLPHRKQCLSKLSPYFRSINSTIPSIHVFCFERYVIDIKNINLTDRPP